VRYIHLNPVRAQLVSDLRALSRYPYCGHSVLMGRQKQPWQDDQYVLSHFGKTTGTARELKMPLTNLARKLDMTVSGVGYAVQRGESIALRYNYRLFE
jgi:hypothetical protein